VNEEVHAGRHRGTPDMNMQVLTPKVLADGLGFTEGPVFRQAGDVVAVSIDRGHLYRIIDGHAELLAETGGGPNGAAEGKGGEVFIAQNGGALPARRWPYITGGVQVIRAGGKVDWLTQDPISPNDLCFGPDGLLYVTDPTRGRRDDGRLWRCDPVTGESELLASVAWYPNGIGFAREDDALYVASSGDATIRRFPLTSSGVGKPETVIRMKTGLPDGFAFDIDDHIVIAAPSPDDPGTAGSVQTWTLEGELLDELHPGNSPYYTNVAISSDARLIITDSSRGGVLVVEDWPSAGLPLHPFRGKRESDA
jgi:gluconolactonase